ncbi:MAG TPA: carboxymuconolactone decarboxylase family protein [Solimonas sp.]|nr:carboxymuconolactone decarboxylase family protein [Solimonas sp.]
MSTDAIPQSPRREALNARIQAFSAELRREAALPPRLIELLRLRIAFHNQCRYCMSMRYGAALDDGLTEDLVCSLQKPAEDPDFSPAEKAALAFADRFATDHLAIDTAMLAGLREHFAADELADLGALAACFTGFGRMGAVFDGGETLPVGPRKADGSRLAPWEVQEPVVVR